MFHSPHDGQRPNHPEWIASQAPQTQREAVAGAAAQVDLAGAHLAPEFLPAVAADLDAPSGHAPPDAETGRRDAAQRDGATRFAVDREKIADTRRARAVVQLEATDALERQRGERGRLQRREIERTGRRCAQGQLEARHRRIFRNLK